MTNREQVEIIRRLVGALWCKTRDTTHHSSVVDAVMRSSAVQGGAVVMDRADGIVWMRYAGGLWHSTEGGELTSDELIARIETQGIWDIVMR